MNPSAPQMASIKQIALAPPGNIDVEKPETFGLVNMVLVTEMASMITDAMLRHAMKTMYASTKRFLQFDA